MIFEIKHHTTYQYEEQVFPEPHHLYFRPSDRNHIKVQSFALTVNPTYSGLVQRLDAENNAFFQCWFNDTIQCLDIMVDMVVETWETNPFYFLIEDSYKRDHLPALQIYLTRQPLSDQQTSWVSQIKDLSGDNLVTFLTYITKEIQAGWKHIVNYSDKVISPKVCFENKEGSCRDLAWMLIQLLRNSEIPARFVSGYAFNPDLRVDHELHAWVEAWLPGAGWIGLDPSAGILTNSNYIPVSSSYIPENTLPVQGNFRGTSKAELTFEVSIKQID